MDAIFPDEILLKIFRYIPRLSLFRGFYNLNSRLNRIISEARVYFGDFPLNEEEQKYILPYVQPKQIRWFGVCDEKYRYSKFNQCINMQRLIFHHGSKYNVLTYNHPDLIHVKPTIFPALKTLKIYVQSNSDVYINLCIMIFSNQFPTLETVHLPYGNGRHWTSGIKTWSPNLKDVTIQCCNMSMYYPLLNNLPNILRFHCGFGVNFKASLTKQCLPLTHVTLETFDIWSTSSDGYFTIFGLYDMMDLFKRSPNLVSATLYICDSRSLEDIIEHLNRVLSNCPKIQDIFCDIRYSQENSVSINEIKKRYRLFENRTAFTSKQYRRYQCIIKD